MARKNRLHFGAAGGWAGPKRPPNGSFAALPRRSFGAGDPQRAQKQQGGMVSCRLVVFEEENQVGCADSRAAARRAGGRPRASRIMPHQGARRALPFLGPPPRFPGFRLRRIQGRFANRLGGAQEAGALKWLKARRACDIPSSGGLNRRRSGVGMGGGGKKKKNGRGRGRKGCGRVFRLAGQTKNGGAPPFFLFAPGRSASAPGSIQAAKRDEHEPALAEHVQGEAAVELLGGLSVRFLVIDGLHAHLEDDRPRL